MFHWRPPLNQTASAVRRTLGELFGIGDLRIVRVQHAHVLEAEPHPRRDDPRLVVGDELALRVPVPAGGRDDDEVLLRPARELDELLVDPGAVEIAAADDDERPFRGSVFGNVRGAAVADSVALEAPMP